MKGKLVLIPTPIDEATTLEGTALKCLLASCSKKESNVFLVEDIRPCRRRWLRWGLPRDLVDDLVEYNEHTRAGLIDPLIKQLKSGKTIYLMSDGGLPAFCDPGQELIDQCHRSKIVVTATPFSNSVALAVALSGYNHQQFVFNGFLPVKNPEREQAYQKLVKEKRTQILMDTPYRLKKTLEELDRHWGKTEFFLGLDLNNPTELATRGNAANYLKSLKDFKREFIIVLPATASI